MKDLHPDILTFIHLDNAIRDMNGHPRDQAKVSVHCRWPPIGGNLTLKCVGRGIDNVAVQGRWPLMTGVAQGRYYCIHNCEPYIFTHAPGEECEGNALIFLLVCVSDYPGA